MIIDCRQIAREITEDIKAQVAGLPRVPEVVVVDIANDPAADSYAGMMKRSFNAAGFMIEHLRLPRDMEPDALYAEIDRLNKSDKVDGIIVLKPLPEQIDEEELISKLDPKKDLDGFHPINLGGLLAGHSGVMEPCTARAAVEVLRHAFYQLENAGAEPDDPKRAEKLRKALTGKHVVVIGRSTIVGKPLSLLLLRENATVTICHSRTRNLEALTRSADAVVVAVGVPGFLKSEHVTDRTVVVDVGINATENGIVGDADFEAIKDRVAAISPVPGGVGRVTNAILLSNALTALQNR